jgi:6-pyruvoyl-tetrahydropterin synthase related domain
MTESGHSRRGAALFWCSLALIVAVVLCGLAEPLLTLRRFIPLDPNEGWNAFFSQIAMAGGNLYPAGSSLITNNYPPVSFYVVGVVGLMSGDNIFAGRLVALVSMLVVAANLYYWLRTTGSETRIAFLGAAVFLAFAVTYGGEYVAIDDPQWLAHAIMSSALVVLWRGRASTRAIVIASILMVAAGLTKHLLLPVPIAVTFWLMRRSKSAFATWLVSAGIVLAASLVLLWLTYGADFFTSVRTARLYSSHHAVLASEAALRCFAPLIALSLLWCVAERSQRATFLAAYLLAAAAIGGAAAGGAGVDVNAFFDLLIAASLGAALGIELLWSGSLNGRAFAAESRLRLLGPIAVVALGFCTAAYATTKLPRALANIEKLDLLEGRSFKYISEIKDLGRGHAACEMVGLCYWANTPFTLDLYIYGQKLQTGVLPIASCKTVLQAATVPLIQLQSVNRHGIELLPDACNQIINENYHPIADSDLGVLLVPRRR